MGPGGRSRRGAGEGQAPLRAPGLQAARALDAGEAEEGRQGVAPHQGARRVGRRPDRVPPAESVLSGLTVEDLKAGQDRGEAIRRELTRLGAPRRPVDGEDRQADARGVGRAGVLARRLAVRAQARRLSRAGRASKRRGAAPHPERATTTPRRFPRSPARSPRSRSTALLLDGEVVALDEQRAAQLSAAAEPGTPAAADRHPARGGRGTGHLLRLRPARASRTSTCARFRSRRESRCSSGCCRRSGALRYLEHVEEDGEALYREAERLGLEGVVGKKAAAPYKAGRSAVWLKVRSRKTGDFVVVGFTAPKGSRGGFGALHLGRVRGWSADLHRAGRERIQREAARRGEPDAAGAAATDAAVRRAGAEGEGDDLGRAGDRGARSSTPSGRTRGCCGSRCSCGFGTTSGRRSACGRASGAGDGGEREGGKRREQEAEDVSPSGARDLGRGSGLSVPSSDPGKTVPRSARDDALPFELTNVKKIFWPDDGYTKGDLIDYYRAISPWLLPYLRNRPVVMTRYPDGIGGKSFFQKDAPGFAPDWIRTERMWSEDTQREIDYFVCDDVASLLYVVNLGSIPLHIWSSRAPTLERPDWCVLDLDPKGAPFEQVVEVALAARDAVRADRAAAVREDQRLLRVSTCWFRWAGSARTSSRARSASCSRAASWACSPRSPPSRARSRGGTAGSTSTTSRTAPASCWWRRSACGRCPARRCRCRWRGGR